MDWYPELKGCQVLCLASGGGQQGPLLAAAGADGHRLRQLSQRQLVQDRLVAEREGLQITLVEGDMRDLSVFEGLNVRSYLPPSLERGYPGYPAGLAGGLRVLKEGGTCWQGSPTRYNTSLTSRRWTRRTSWWS